MACQAANHPFWFCSPEREPKGLPFVYAVAYSRPGGEALMSEHITIHFTAAAERELAKVAKVDPERATIIEQLLEEVEENGWTLSTRSEDIKVLDQKRCIGEIRYTGSGGYRLFMFWHDTEASRQIWICRILPKRDVIGKARLNAVVEAVAKVRQRFLKEL
jgi:hypothetical protein